MENHEESVRRNFKKPYPFIAGASVRFPFFHRREHESKGNLRVLFLAFQTIKFPFAIFPQPLFDAKIPISCYFSSTVIYLINDSFTRKRREGKVQHIFIGNSRRAGFFTFRTLSRADDKRRLFVEKAN